MHPLIASPTTYKVIFRVPHSKLPWPGQERKRKNVKRSWLAEETEPETNAPRLPEHAVAGSTLCSTPRPTPADPALARAALVEEEE